MEGPTCPPLPDDVLLRILAALAPNQQALARLTCKAWAHAADALITSANVTGHQHELAASSGRSSTDTTAALAARLAGLPSLGSVRLGPAVLRRPAAAAAHLRALAACGSLTSLVLHPDAQEVCNLPPDVARLTQLKALAVVSATSCAPGAARGRTSTASFLASGGGGARGASTPPSAGLAWPGGGASLSGLVCLASLEVTGFGETGLGGLPGVVVARLQRLVLRGPVDASPLVGMRPQLRGLRSLVLDGCVGVEPLLASLSDLSGLTLLRVANLDFAWWAATSQSHSSPLWQLTGLRSLDLSGNYCRSLSEAISSLSRLSYLNLSSNLMDDLPDSIAQLTGLQVLDLSFNELQQLPAWMPQLSALVALRLHNNLLDSTQMGPLRRLPVLAALSLAHNRLNWCGEGLLGGRTNGSHDCLPVDEHEHEPGSPSPAAAAPDGSKAAAAADSGGIPPSGSPLRVLDLSQNRLLGNLSLLSSLQGLSSLRLRGALAHLAPEPARRCVACVSERLPGLRRLDLSANALSASLVGDLSRLTALQQLQLQDNVLTDLPPGLIRLGASLELLDLRHNRLQQVPIVVRSLVSLYTLCLGANLVSTLPHWLSELQQLRNLDVSRQVRVAVVFFF
ncbi:hypothetical protein FOA52_002298 [Chlamydomonas sp. UWO 241]|nr:hypothetical protein FOA52_002298 [Chlamydomonas sp. UWO 241]